MLRDSPRRAASALPPRSIPTAPIPAGTLVAMLDVLEHIDDDAAALARAVVTRMAPGSDAGHHRAGDAVGVLVVGHRARPPPPLLPRPAARRSSTAAGFDVRVGDATCSPSCSRCSSCAGCAGRRGSRSTSPSSPRRVDAIGHAVALGDDGDPAGCGRSGPPSWPSPPADRDRRRRRRAPRCGSSARCCATPSPTCACTTRCSPPAGADGWADELRFVVVDDSAGTDHEVAQLAAHPDVTVLTPPFGLGHQRAIVYGLRYDRPDVGARRRRRHDGLRRRGPAGRPAAPRRRA